MAEKEAKMCMKIGLLTFHFARNYGAVLQCYALQQYLRSLGYEVFVIDYRPGSIARGYRTFDVRRVWGRTPAKFCRKTLRELRIFKSRAVRYRAFEDFVQRRFRFAKPSNCDAIIVGSDQVWNIALTGGKMDPYYWGKAFTRVKLIAYGASVENGLKLLPTNTTTSSASAQEDTAVINREELREALARFDGVSLRERESLDLFRQYRPDAVLVCDPVLLMSADFWRKVSKSASGTLKCGCTRNGSPSANEDTTEHRGYLLYYQVRASEKGLAYAGKEAQRRGLELLCLSAKLEDCNSPSVATASPEKFIALIDGADYVITTSFHGCVFSLLLHKEFTALQLGDGRDGRIRDLLQSVELCQLISDGSYHKEDSPIEWQNVDEAVDKLRKSSEGYLNKSLSRQV